MNGVLGATTEPPLLTNGHDMANWLVDRNPVLQRLLTVLGCYTEYGVNLDGLRDLIRANDRHFQAMLAYGRANPFPQGARRSRAWDDNCPKHETEAARLFSLMSAAERGRVRLIGTLSDFAHDDRLEAGVEWSLEEVDMFAAADPGLVVDFATALVARFTGI